MSPRNGRKLRATSELAAERDRSLVTRGDSPSRRTVDKASGGGSRHEAERSRADLGGRIFRRHRPSASGSGAAPAPK